MLTPPSIQYGRLFRELRINRGFTITEICGPLSLSAVSRFERGQAEQTELTIIYRYTRI